MRIDRQKKIILLLLPLIAVFLLSLFYFIFTYVFKNKEKAEAPTLATHLPDVPRKIEDNKSEAYNNQKIYEKTQNESDFLLSFNIDTTQYTLKTENKKKSANTISSSPSPYQKKLEQELVSTEKKYRQFTGKQKPAKKSQQSPNMQTQSMPPPDSFPGKPEPVKFHSLMPSSLSIQKEYMAIMAYIHNEQTVTDRSQLKIRTGKAFLYKNIWVPENTILWGTCNLNNGRVFFTIHNIWIGNRLIPCDIHPIDIDGQEGIKIHDTGTEAGKKNAASSSKKIGTTLGTAVRAISPANIAGEVAGIASEGIAKSITDGISDKVKLKKATLTNNYMFYLKLDK